MSLPVAVLAGGLATRLRPLTEQIPKVLVEVAGRPFAVHQLELLRKHGYKRVVFCLGHLGDQVCKILGDGRSWGMDIRYMFDGPKLLGTGGALHKALPLLGDAFLVIYGDSYLECNYAAVEKAFLTSEKLGLMTVFNNGDRWDRSNVIFRNGRIMYYDKRRKNPEMHHIDYGLGAFNSRAFDTCSEEQAIDLADIYQDLLTKDELAGFEVSQRFYEIGSPAGLEETCRYLAETKNAPAVFLDRDGVINRVIMRDGKPCSPRTLEEFEWEEGALEAISRLKYLNFKVIVVTNQPDISRGKMDRSVLDLMTHRIYSLAGVDSVWVCPHDDGDACHCRKPKPGMIHDAASCWGVESRRSFLIGDGWRDMDAGRSAGCTTILLDRPYNRGAPCDHRVPGINEAVDLVVKLQKAQERRCEDG